MKSDVIPERLPKHIAFIMDGNGRWASKRLLPRKLGHREGVKAMHKTVNACFDMNIPYVTVYAFSTENKKRPEDEVKSLFSLMEEYFSEFLGDMLSKDVRVTVMGDISYFPDRLRNIITDAINKSADCKHGTLNIALNYGARDEILRAVNKGIEQGKPLGGEEFSRLLYTCDMPDPDIIVRTGGEYRLSNFMLYQCAYSELFFTDTLWPDFNKKHLIKILNDFALRERRYGKIKT